jgi:hypothetical protein
VAPRFVAPKALVEGSCASPGTSECSHGSQKPAKASCSASTLGNPRAEAAAEILPNCAASPEMVWPWQSAWPTVPWS